MGKVEDGVIPPMEFDPAAAVPAPAELGAEPAEMSLPEPVRRGRRTLAVLLGSLVGLFLAGLAFDTADLVMRANAVSPFLGGMLAGFGGLAVAALVVLAGREVGTMARLRHVEGLRTRAATLHAAAGHGRAHPLLAELEGLFRDRPELETARSGLRTALGDAHDDRDVIDLADRLLLAPLDRTAYALVLRESRDLALMTMLSPSALLDSLLVLWRNARLVRRIATLYGTRPGLVGSALLARRMVANIGLAGLAEAGDSLAVDALGGTLAASVSARLGQGLLNGLLTARIGLAAMALCRPLPFTPERRPRLAEIRKELLSLPKQVL